MGGSVDLLKIDCEGCEFELIPSMHSFVCNTQSKVKRITGEMHGSRKYQPEIFRYLNKKNVKTTRQFLHSCPCQEVSERWLMCDHRPEADREPNLYPIIGQRPEADREPNIAPD